MVCITVMHSLWLLSSKMSLGLFLALVSMKQRPFFQLDMKHVFLHDDLEEISMEQLCGIVAQASRGSSLVCKSQCWTYG